MPGRNINAELSITINKNDIAQQIIEGMNIASKEISDKTVTYHIAADSSQLEKTLKELERQTPEIMKGIVIDFDTTQLDKQLDKLNSYSGKSAKEIGREFSRSLNSSISKNISDNDLKKLIQDLSKDIDLNFDISNAKSLSELEDYVTLVQRLDNALKLVTGRNARKIDLEGIDIAELQKAVRSKVGEVNASVGVVIDANKSQWLEQLQELANADFSGLIKLIEEIKKGLSSFGKGGTGTGGASSELDEVEKQIRETEAALNSAREEAEKYGKTLDELKQKIDQTYNKSVNKDTQRNANSFRTSVQDYIKAGGSEKDLNKDILDWYKMSGTSWPKNFIPLNQIKNESSEAQNEIKDLQKKLNELYATRDRLKKGSSPGSGSGLGSGIGIGIDAKEIQTLIKSISDLVEQIKRLADLKTSEDILSTENVEQLEQKFNTIASNFGDDLSASVDDLVAALNDVDNRQWSFENLKKSLLDIVTQFQNSLAQVGLTNTQLDDAYKMIKGWNDADSYSVTRGNKTLTQERGAFLNSKSGTASNPFFADAEKSFSVGLFNAIEELSVGLNGEIGDIYDTFVHSHPFRTTLDKLKTKGSDIGFSYSDLDIAINKFLKEKISNMLVTNNYKYANLDLSGVTKTTANELLRHFRSELVKSGLELDEENRFSFPKDLATNGGIFDLDQKSNIINGALQQALKNVELDPNRLTTGNIDDLKIDLSQLDKQSEEVAFNFKELLDVLQNISNVLNDINTKGFKFDTTQKGQKQNIDPDKIKPQVDQSSIISEQQALEKLEQAINSVTAALAQKVKVTQAGEVQTDLSVNHEIAKLKELESKLTELKTQFENGLSFKIDNANIDANGALKNPDGAITNPEIDVDLKPTVDADKFKSDAERLLAFVDVDKKVDLNVGDVKTDNTSKKESKNNIYSELANNIIKDFNIKGKKVKNKIQELAKSIYDNIDLSGSSEKYGNNFASTFDELGKVVVDNANIIQQKTGIYEEFFNYIKGLSSIKIPDVVRTDLGDDWDVLRKTYASKFSTTKGIELDSIYQEMASQFKDLFSGTSDQAEQFKEIINNIRAYRKDINKTVPLSDDNIDEIYSELLNRIKEMRDKIKVELGNSVNDKDNLKNEMQIQPLINNQEWIDAIDDILKLIGTRKVPIVPDTESNEWKEFSNFVNKISNKVIQLKINEDNRKQYSSTNLPPELNDSYKNSTKYTNELYKIEEEIYKVKEKVNRKDSESLSVLEEKKKKYEDLLNAEKQFREKDQFKDLDTSAKDSQLNKLISSKQLELEANKNIIDSQLQERINQDWDAALKENKNFDNNKKVIEMNNLLDQQQQKYQEIYDIKVKISTLDPIDKENDIINLNQQKTALENELNVIENQLNAYDDLIDKKEQSKKLDFIERTGNFDINENTSNRVKELDNAIYSNLKQQSDLELKNLSTTGLTADEQSKLNDLKNEYVVLTEKANKALTEEYGKLTSIDKVLNHIKDMQGLGINGVGRVNDVDVAENEGLSINNALNQTSQRMNELRNLGQTDLFGQIFQQAESEVNELNNRLINSDITLTEYNKNIKSIQSTLSKQTNAVAFFDPGDIEGTMQLMRSLALQIPGIQQDTLKWSNNNKILTATLQEQNGEWKKVTLNAQVAGKTINQTFNNIQTPISGVSKFIDDLGAKFHNLGTYLLSFVGFYEIWGAIQQGFTYVRELDSALTEMRKVSDETVESLREFQEVSFDIADSVGSTAKTVQNSTADWMRLGESMEEAAKSAQATSILLNVSEFEDINSATDALISMSQAYSDLDKMDIVDKANNIGM